VLVTVVTPGLPTPGGLTPSRRERLRTATVSEIKDTARRQLVAGGPASISLRAIARDMGLTAAALYRYFPSLDALLEQLCADLYAELTESVVAARDAVPVDDPRERLCATCRAFRHWCLAHPAEFALMFGSPPPGTADFDDGCAVHQAGAAFSAVFIDSFLALWHRRSAPAPTVDPRIVAGGPLGDVLCGALPPAAQQLFLSGWILLYGLVAMEVFGHLRWAVTDAEPLFEAELATYLHRLTAG
jgi:AcrR family transcriptional regulator